MSKYLSATVLSLLACCTAITFAGDGVQSPHAAKFPDEACQRAAAETSAAIEAAAGNSSKKQLSQIVFNAVRSSPGCVLAIVHSAALASPREAVPQIVSSATAALPNPWKEVAYRRLITRPGKTTAPDFKGGPGEGLDLGGREPDGKTIAGGGADHGNVTSAGYGTNSGVWPAWTAGPEPIYGGELSYGPYPWTGDGSGADGPDGSPMSLAQAVVQAAFDARPGFSSRSLVSAADSALLTDPGFLMRSIQGIGSLSAVGDDGVSNYANEPRRLPPPGVFPILPPVPPVVSR